MLWYLFHTLKKTMELPPNIESVPGSPVLAAARNRAKSIALNALALFLPWAIVLSGLALTADHMETGNLREPIISAQHEQIERVRQAMARRLATTVQDVRFLSSSPVLQDVVDGNVGRIPQVIDLFRHFSNVAGKYSEIRWIDETGQERIRVDNRGEGAFAVPSAQLQDKSKRPVFVETMRLTAGQTYFSRFDLSVENDKLEIPYKPMLRIAAPVFDLQGSRRGIVALNFLGDDLLNWVRESAALTNATLANVTLELLDGEGYWLLSEHREDAWGFMLGHPERSLATRAPDVWQVFQSAPSGILDHDHALWSFGHFRANQSEIDTSYGPASALDWVVVSRLPDADLRQRELSVHMMFFVVALLALVLGGGVCYHLAATRHDRMVALTELQERTTELASANIALRQSFDTQRAIQNELVRAEKLSSLGMMVAGVAHELNTPLGSAVVTVSCLDRAVREFSEKVQDGLRQSDLATFLAAQKEGLPILQYSLERAAGLVQRFKQLAVDRQTEERRKFDLREVIESSLHLVIKRQASQPQQLVIDVPTNLEMDSYPGPLGQAIDNLVRNAFMHAFPAGRIGTVQVIAQRNTDEDDVIIRVIDNGIGISSEIRERVFELFFTTRRNDGGTGLGLFLAHQLVHEILGGKLQLVEASLPGCCFVMTLPRVAPVAEAS